MHRMLIVAIVVVLLGTGAYMFYAARQQEQAPGSKAFVIQIADRKVASGPTTITVNRGDSVTIRITADEEEEFHLHGYDRSVDLEPGEEAVLTFTADIAGRFTAELEISKTELIALEVMP